ncbi:MAG: RNA polymerase sigma-54 factor, partial [Desulfobacterales bacterium]|nr:RNA polymerase sigma-54 factor [Desulfobacterales bacterium]
MTPRLQQAIKFLQLCRLELLDAINQEMEENPVLEDAPEEVSAEGGGDSGPITTSVEPSVLKPVTAEETARSDIDWSNYLGEYNTPGPVYFEAEKREVPEYENFVARRESLNEHLMWQLLLSLPSRREERIGSAIIGNLNRDGYLRATVDEIATLAEADTSEAESVLGKMQSFDPPGVCARDLRECLLIQMRQLGLQDSIVVQVIRNHIKDLENKNYKAISRA